MPTQISMSASEAFDRLELRLGRICHAHARLERLLYVIRYQLEATDKAGKRLQPDAVIGRATELPGQVQSFLEVMKAGATPSFGVLLDQIAQFLDKPSAKRVLGKAWKPVMEEWLDLADRMRVSSWYRNFLVHAEFFVSGGVFRASVGDAFTGGDLCIRFDDLDSLRADQNAQWLQASEFLARIRPLLRGDADSLHIMTNDAGDP